MGRGKAERASWAPTSNWWKDAVIYQVYPRSFSDSNDDGVGDLAGVTGRLPYLAELGVDAVWISPFYPSPMHDFGYDVSDYTDVDPVFGTLADFDELVATAHGLGLAVLVDWVPNHTSIEHPWFVASRQSSESPHADWYVWHDAVDGGPPNNWQSVFGGSAWEWDDQRAQYYLHSFLREQPDLNWRNPAVQSAMFETVQFWLDRGVDGFRIDVAHYLMKDPDLRDNPPALASSDMFKDMGDYDRFDHLHDKGHVDIHQVFRDLRAMVAAHSDHVVTIGEIHEWDLEKWSAYYGEGDELHMPFNFTLLYTPWDAGEFRRRVAAIERVVPEHGWPNHVFGNHDEPRLASRFGRDRARLAAMLLLTLRGTPTMYYGDELGMTDVDIPPSRIQDPWGQRVPGLGRDGARTPMPWTGAPHGGFTAPQVEPWLPVGTDVPPVDEQQRDAGSLLRLYRSLLRLRRQRVELRRGSIEFVNEDDGGVLRYIRRHGGAASMIVLNLSSDDSTTRVGPGAQVLLASDGHLRHVTADGDLLLEGNAGVIIALPTDGA